MNNNHGPPPPPPPPGQFRGPGAGPPGGGGGNRPPPPPGHGHPQGPPQGPPQQQKPPPMNNSTRLVDLRPKPSVPPMDEAAFRKMLTQYSAFSVRKASPASIREEPTWARAEVVDERLEQGEIAKQIKRLSEKSKRSVAEQKAALAPNQHKQVTNLLDELISRERDPYFTYSLAQIDLAKREIRRSSKDSRKKSSSKSSTKLETTLMMIYVQRSPHPHINCRQFYENIERAKAEANRPPPPPPPPQQQPPPPPPGPLPGPPNNQGGGGNPPFVTIHGAKSPGRGKSPGRKGPRHNDSASSSSSGSSSYDSDSDSMSRTDSSMTSMSSRSKHGRDHGRSHSRRPPSRSFSRARGRSQSRLQKEAPRHHQKDPYVDVRRGPSPEPWLHNMASPQPTRTITNTPVAPVIDAFEAYRLGRMDAKADLAEHQPARVPHRPVVVHDPPVRALTYGPRRNSLVEPHHPGPHLPRQYALEPRYETPVAPRHREERYHEQPRAFVPEVRDYRYPDYHRGPPRAEQFVSDFQDFQSDDTMPRSPSPPPFRDFDLRRQERDVQDYQDRIHRGDARILPMRNLSINPNPFSPIPALRRQYSPTPSFSSSSRGW